MSYIKVYKYQESELINFEMKLVVISILSAWVCVCTCVLIHTVICSMRTALVASVSCSRLFMCSILRVAVVSFWLSSSMVGSTVHTNGSREQTKVVCKLNDRVVWKSEGKTWKESRLDYTESPSKINKNFLKNVYFLVATKISVISVYNEVLFRPLSEFPLLEPNKNGKRMSNQHSFWSSCFDFWDRWSTVHAAFIK